MRWLIRWADAIAQQEIKRLREERDNALAAERVAQVEIDLLARSLAREIERVKAETAGHIRRAADSQQP